MFASLRTRLWLSYAVMIGVILVVVGGGLFLVIARSSFVARQIAPRLRGAEGAAYGLLEIRILDTAEREQAIIDRVTQLYGVHIAILNVDGKVEFESGLANNSPFPELTPPLVINSSNLSEVSTLRDSRRRLWYYTLRQLDTQSPTFLMVASLRPQIPWLTILSDDVGRPLIETGVLALAAAFFLAILIGRWIANPLKDIASASKRIAGGDTRPIVPHGPAEVKDLANSFNEMAAKVQSSQRSQRDFVANISHELKTPLTAIQGFAQAIFDGAVNSPEMINQAAGVILTESDRMYRLVNDLLTLARLDAGTASLVSESVDLSDLLQRVAAKFEPAARAGQIILTHQIESIPVINGDGDRLVQVFNNLVDNAIKYTPANGWVHISTRVVGDQVEIKVADSGSGIAPEDQERIFERFYQADKSRHGGAGRGVGLGLAIARQIIQAEGGSITVSSTLGQGSAFIVRLPLRKS